MKTQKCRFTMGALGFLALATVAASPAQAASYPVKPVKIITQAPPGAGPDVILRIVTASLTKLWGQQVQVINRPGGGGLVAAEAAATTSERDGYTLYMASGSALVALPVTHAKLPFNFERDFVPVGLIGEQPFVIAVPPALKVNTLPELIALAKRRPGELNYAANLTGTAPQLTAEFFRIRSSIKATFVPYAGGAQAALSDIMSGRISMIVESLSALAGPIHGNIVKPLAVTSAQRLPQFPDLPTVAETIPGFVATGWFVMMAPSGTPHDVVEKVSRDLRSVLEQPDVVQKLATLGTYSRAMSSAELTAFIRNEQQKWKPILQQSGSKS